MTTRITFCLPRSSYGGSYRETRSVTASRERIIHKPPKRENDNPERYAVKKLSLSIEPISERKPGSGSHRCTDPHFATDIKVTAISELQQSSFKERAPNYGTNISVRKPNYPEQHADKTVETYSHFSHLNLIEDSRHSISSQRNVCDNTNNLQLMSNSIHPSSNPSHVFNNKQTNVITHMEHDTGKDEQLIREPTRGLKNLGNTCFMNCILQCLSHTLPLRDFFVSDEYKKNLKTKGDLSDAFKCAMSELWKSSFAVDSYAPHDLKKRVEIVAPRFSGYNQHDAQEFMRFLLNELHEEINKADVKGRKSPGDNENLQEACDRYLTWENSLISELFSGMLHSEVCCSVCEHRSVVFIPFMDLALPIPRSKSTSPRYYGHYSTVKLDACMQVFTEEEILDEEERPYCNKCKNMTKSTKQLSISKLPKFLVIQLKRFSGYSVRRKLSTPVQFEERWEICDNSGKTHAYSLYGIACHSGGIYGGHYTAYCKYNKQWRCFDDRCVAAEKWDYVRYQKAYILFYEKIDNNYTPLLQL